MENLLCTGFSFQTKLHSTIQSKQTFQKPLSLAYFIKIRTNAYRKYRFTLNCYNL